MGLSSAIVPTLSLVAVNSQSVSSLPALLRLLERVWLIIVADCRRTVASSTAVVVVVVVAAAATTTLEDRGCFPFGGKRGATRRFAFLHLSLT